MRLISDTKITNLAAGSVIVDCRVRVQQTMGKRRHRKTKVPSRFQVQPTRETRRDKTKISCRFRVQQMRGITRPGKTKIPCRFWIQQMRDTTRGSGETNDVRMMMRDTTRGSGETNVVRMMYAFANFCHFLF